MAGSEAVLRLAAARATGRDPDPCTETRRVLEDPAWRRRIVLIDRRGMQRIGFPASQTTPERLAHDIRALEAE